ncbi:acyltransferase family protein [Sphingomonas immobilis]|uniref:acyltransferase family protein n=1 Tax=Sphingomonas immobilis TaxID=3063997 RepID=UPI00272D1788|nr:acyltransferase [Sphingomonas sp. CA1-15]
MTSDLIQEAERQRKFYTLDGLRGVAAIAVAMFHFAPLVAPVMLGSSYLAVDLFFLMSGFVIAYSYERKFASGMGVGKFMLVRVIRLYPMYILGTAIFALPIAAALLMRKDLVWTVGGFSTAMASALLMLPSPPIPGKSLTLFVLNPPAWSLFYELLSNLLFAAIFPVLSDRIVKLLIAVSALGLVASAFAFGNLEGGAHWNDFVVGFARVGFSFFLGVLLCRLHRLKRLPAWRVPPVMILIASVAVLSISVSAGARPFFDLFAVIALFPLLVIAALANEPKANIRAYTVPGLISYPLYTIHMPALALVTGVMAKFTGGRVEQFAPAIGIALIVVLALAAWGLAQTYDVAARKMLTRLTARFGSGLKAHSAP